jgi:hypothetical protein
LSELKRCRWKNGCELPVSLTDSRDGRFCYFHSKVDAGLIDSPDLGVSRRRPQVKGSDVLGDEQGAVAQVLRQADTPETIVKRAVTKQIVFKSPRDSAVEKRRRAK